MNHKLWYPQFTNTPYHNIQRFFTNYSNTQNKIYTRNLSNVSNIKRYEHNKYILRNQKRQQSTVSAGAVTGATASEINTIDTKLIDQTSIRSVAIIAHVDHGKTTLVDALLRDADTHVGNETRLMDTNTLEKERGITILAKCTSVFYNSTRDKKEYQINIVDTPGHADFGGEVERIMTMVDGVILIVDSTEGPMAQTKFVLSKALAQGQKPIVVINKVDKSSQRIQEVEDEILELFFNLDANEEQLEYPILYASGRSGWVSSRRIVEKDDNTYGMKELFEYIIDYIPPPKVNRNEPFQMLVTQIESDQYFGKCLIGCIKSGTIKPGDTIHALDENDNIIETTKVLKLIRRRGMTRYIINEACAGDIISLAGFTNATVNSTLCDVKITKSIPSIPIDPPTLSMIFHVNTSPIAGKEGQAITSNALKLRLIREAENNVSIKVMEKSNDGFEVRARGEQQLGIILETLRREGIEISVSPPSVVYNYDKDTNTLLEPMEEVIIDVIETYSGIIIDKLSRRGGNLKDFITLKDSRTRLVFNIPTRGFLGYRTEFINDTRGTGIINSSFLKYVPYIGDISRNEKGALISMEDGICTSYALEACETRGILFVETGTQVYRGMVIGENSRSDDMELNPVKSKALTNVRAAGKDDKIRLSPPKKFTIEELISYVRDDEIIEITPKNVRLRKKILDSNLRKTAAKSAKSIALKALQSGGKVSPDAKFLTSLTIA